MIPVIFILIAWWAGSGVVASVKAARSTNPTPAAAAAAGAARAKGGTRSATVKGSTAGQSNSALGPGNVTFGQWQRSLYKRWKTNVRKHLPGQHLGRKAADLIGDITAASIAGAAVFGAGFASGTTWAGMRWSGRGVRKAAGASRQSWPGGPSVTRPTTGPGAGPGPHTAGPQAANKPPGTSSADDVIDAEIVDGTENPTAAPSPYANAEDAVLIGVPELLAYYPTAPNGDLMAEILNIHHLLDYAKTAIAAATDSADQAGIRANSAGERADQASNRGITAGNRAASAELVAADATAQATQLEEAAARFGGLNMDGASLASITSSIESANTLAADERRRAEAEAQVAVCAAALAQAEEIAAATAATSAKSAIAHVEVVKAMHDTVQARQMPHAEAQAMTGNAAAHESLLAAN